MQANIRAAYNRAFTEAKYEAFLADLNSQFNYVIPFRVAETPLFVSLPLKQRLLEACTEIINTIRRDDFKTLTQAAIPPSYEVPREDAHTQLLAIDFAICRDAAGELLPQLIELQGFPSLYGFQELVAKAFRRHFDIPDNYSHLLGDLTEQDYWAMFRQIILNGHAPENVILLEIEPTRQKTYIDFAYTRARLGIEPVCLSEVILEGKQLYYRREGKKIRIHRIYNRVIFDELAQRPDLLRQFNLTEDVEVEWAGHPNWFFRISKYTLPLLQSSYVPQSWYLDKLPNIPTDLENYVLKPLFSFAGAGVKFDVSANDLAAIAPADRPNYLLQRKVHYTNALVDVNGEPVKAEVRMLFLWAADAPAPQAVMGLGRLSKGKMIGVDFNKDKTWVGGTGIFFERE